ncbi:MAG: signal peptide peptidase SppA [Xenococcaceae cyanobacterium MO_188.B32]|nr:signal peptide peptidase SppA [Xenococcaceae cyanobacterium MO_188.B32]
MGQFLKQTFASLIGSLAGLFLFCAIGTSSLVFLFFMATSQQKEPQVKEKSILTFDLSTEITDSQSPANFANTIYGESSNTITLRKVLNALEKATKDERVVGIFLDGRKGVGSSGYATLAEVRTALERFQAEGKKIIAYDVNWSEREYYLASIADEVILNPMGIMEINGLSSQQMFFQGALEKYGIGVQVIRVGSYKSAVEPYTRKNLSQENRQQTQALLTDLWSKFLSTVGESRQLSPEKLQAIADKKGFVRPKYALKAGLIDEVAYFDKAIASLKELTEQKAEAKNESVRQIALNTYANASDEDDISLENSFENKIAVVYAEGSIVGGKGNIQEIGSDRFAKEFRQLREDESVKAVVLRVNSPGGSATASEVILREILLTRKHKPVIVSMGNIAASGGYWISAGADRIFAEENTITGSIGVFGLLTNIQEIGNNHGVTWDVVKTGRFADISSNVRPKTEEELAIYQKSVTNTYNLFLNKVAQYRNLSRQQVDEIAQGRIWSGKEAHKIGLVDQIGGLEDAIAHAAETAKLGKNWQLEEYPQQRSLEVEILDKLMNIKTLAQTDSLDPLTLEFLKLKSDLTIFQSLNDPQGIYARLPFNLDIE